MTKPASTPATYADLEKVPPNLVGEIIDGVLETHPRPLPRHAMASAEIVGTLRNPFRLGNGGPGGWIFMVEPELHLGPHVLVPDIAGWKRERVPTMPEQVGITTAPDWVCEILSPSTARLDQGPKRQIYAAQGVAYIWLLNPDTRVLDAYQLVAGKWVLQGTATGADEVCLPPFNAISFPLDALFPLDPPFSEDSEG
jgi:Uma2 family endonuclease